MVRNRCCLNLNSPIGTAGYRRLTGKIPRISVSQGDRGTFSGDVRGVDLSGQWQRFGWPLASGGWANYTDRSTGTMRSDSRLPRTQLSWEIVTLRAVVRPFYDGRKAAGSPLKYQTVRRIRWSNNHVRGELYGGPPSLEKFGQARVDG